MNENKIRKVADHSVVIDAQGKKIKPKVEGTMQDYVDAIVSALGWARNKNTFNRFLQSNSLEHDRVIVSMYHNGFGVN